MSIDIVIYAIIGIVLIALGCLFKNAHANPEFRRVAPAIMVSLGILGTFLGILTALLPLDFSEGKIGDSITALLGGMKTAFITSCMGLAAGIFARWYWWSDKNEPEPIGRGENEIIRRLEEIRNAIAGDGDGSLTAELRDLRRINSEGFAKLDGLTEEIRKAITESLVQNLQNLIKEIRTVIRDELSKSLKELITSIDKTINEKLGQKLDQFNASVDTVRLWQVQHRAQMRELGDRAKQMLDGFETVAEGINKIKDDCAEIPKTMREVRGSLQETEGAIAQIRTECAKIPETMNELREVLVVAQQQVGELDARLKAFADMKEKAEAAFPAIDRKLNEVLNAMNGVAAQFAGMENTVKDIVEKIHTETLGEIKSSHERAKEVADKHAGEVKEIVAGMRNETEEAVKGMREKWEEEVQKAGKAWGDNLVPVAEKCAELINEIRKSGDKQQ